jgi:hypothetical protein
MRKKEGSDLLVLFSDRAIDFLLSFVVFYSLYFSFRQEKQN